MSLRSFPSLLIMQTAKWQPFQKLIKNHLNRVHLFSTRPVFILCSILHQSKVILMIFALLRDAGPQNFIRYNINPQLDLNLLKLLQLKSFLERKSVLFLSHFQLWHKRGIQFNDIVLIIHYKQPQPQRPIAELRKNWIFSLNFGVLKNSSTLGLPESKL